MNFLASTLICTTLLGTCGLVQAEVIAPDTLVKSTTEAVLVAIRQNQNQAHLIKVAESTVLPHFDFTRMTRLAVGRGWGQATAEQQQALVNEFRSLIVRTYTGALAASKNADTRIIVSPLPALANVAEVMVRTKVMRPGARAVPIDYDMENLPEGWKVFDVVVDGVSLVTNYRQIFSAELRESGVDGLVKFLAVKNRLAANGPVATKPAAE